MMSRVAILAFVALTFFTAVFGSNVDPIIKIRKYGFDRDHKTFSHEVIAPWARPFKPGYCDSWEWHTVPRYKEARLKLCRELAGDRKHECEDKNGCKDKCPYSNGTFPYWRIRNADNVPFLWTVKTIKMFDTTHAKVPLHKDPTKGYASTFFGPGYYASNAFDNNEDSMWVSNGVSSPGLNWIAYEFDHPVKINSVHLTGEAEHPDRTPSQWYVEASCEKYFKTFSFQWLIENHNHATNKRFNRPRGSK